ncbi:MAG: hypothetical protein ACI81L_003297 [Verrucomicrobiales bacterium]|jgi:hypothetical protein
METNPTLPAIEPERVEALAVDAVADRPLTAAGEASLARAVGRLTDGQRC